MLIKEHGIKSPKDMEKVQTTEINWSIIEKNIYQGNKEKSYELLKKINHDNLSNLNNQKYYFFLGKYYHINDFLSTAAMMYVKSYLYAQIGNFPTLESKKSAINLSNIMIETIGPYETITQSLLDHQNNIIVSEPLNVEKLLTFSLDQNYPRGYYLLASYYNHIFWDNLKNFKNDEEKIDSINLILSFLNKYFKLETGTEKLNILDTSNAVEIKKNLLPFKKRLQEESRQ